MNDAPRPLELTREGSGSAPGEPVVSRDPVAAREPSGAGAVAQRLADALTTAMALLAADAGAVYVRRPGVGLVLATEVGLTADELVRLRASPVRPELALPVPMTGSATAAPVADREEDPASVVTRGVARPERTGGFPTVCTFPVTTPGGERWGLLELYFRRPRRLARSRREIAEALVRQLGWALERDRRAAAVERHLDDARAGDPGPQPEDGATVARELGRQQRAAERAVWLQTVTAALARASSVTEVCEVAVRQCVAASGASAGACFLASGGALLSATATHAADGGTRAPVAPGAPEKEAFDTGRLVCAGERGDRCVRVALPLAAGEEVHGVLVLQYARPERMEVGDREYLTALARVAAQALERVRLHAAARAASQAKSDFLAMMSHELRTPLNAIMGYTGLIADEVVGPLNLTQRDQLHRVQEHARHLLTLIEEILTLSRAEVGRDELRLTLVDPVRLLREVADVLAPSAARKELSFDVEVVGEPGMFRTDADKVRQVLAHLLTNAIKFTAEGSVTARVEEVEENGHRTLVYAVRDTGVGIAPDHLMRIFEPFWQADQARTRRFPGTGLGLNVTRRLADLLGGEVSVTSTPGEGSEFVFRVPVRE
ncbi:MAG TPA: GAF domain-containing sensor histidine kinase [Gemmatimonadaceae bacterium]|nr:GAF domain-containing sensor histidine kinase [Gemmatimonadaceae bacterium]